MHVTLRHSALWLLACTLVPLGCKREEPVEPAPAAALVPEAPVEAPDPYEDSPSRFGNVPLYAGFSPDPRVVTGEARGEVEARSVHRKCRGWIAQTPDYRVEAETAFFKLYVLARSRSDTTLVVRKPDGSVLCNDNRAGSRDPMVRGDFPIGTTQIWVGVKEQGATARYRLGFSEVKGKASSLTAPDPD